MNQQDAKQTYLYHFERIEALLESMGNNPQAINTFITNTYAELYKNNPAFLWFGLGSIISKSVGQNIKAATDAIVNSAGQATPATVVLDKFSEGNQEIFKSILAMFLTYNSIGLEGIELLKDINFGESIQNPFQNQDILDALTDYAYLQTQQKEIANSLGLSLNDQKVVETLFAEQKNIDLAKSISVNITFEEQQTAQSIYSSELVSILQNPVLEFTGHLAQLDNIKILDTTYNFYDYIDNPADIDQRLHFAEKLIEVIGDGISNGQYEQFQAEVISAANHTFWLSDSNLEKIDTMNGAFWGIRADEHEAKVKNSIIAFLYDEPDAQELVLTVANEENELAMLASLFSDDIGNLKTNIEPLDFFLATNPNYKVIANDITELWFNPELMHEALPIGTKLWNPVTSYLDYFTQIEIYNDGNYYLNQGYGDVRGVTFPFLYNTETGKPLTMPIVDVFGHYDHASTVETIYKNPQAFETPSHPNWNNPFWDYQIELAQEAAANAFLQSTSNSFMNAVLTPFPNVTFYYGYNSSGSHATLSTGDVIQTNTDNIDFSNLNSSTLNDAHYSNNANVIVEFSNSGLLVGYDTQGNFGCLNCHDYGSEYYG